MKKPSRKSKPQKGARKAAVRKVAKQVRRASISACDTHSAPLASPSRRGRDATNLIPAFGLGLARPVLPAVFGLAWASTRGPRHALRRALPAAFPPQTWPRAFSPPAFEDREALAFMSLPLVALSLMLALGLIELGRHRHPMYRGLEMASAARPTALPRTPAPAVPFVAGNAPPPLAATPATAVLAAESPPPSIAVEIARPGSVAETALTGTLASLAPKLAAPVRSPIMPKSRRDARVVASNLDGPATLREAVVTPPVAAVPNAPLPASEDTSTLSRLAAAAPVLPEPAYPAPRAAAPIAAPVALAEAAHVPPYLAARVEAQPVVAGARQVELIAAAQARLVMLDPLAPGTEIAAPSPLLQSLYSRYEPGSGPEYCAAAPPAPRPIRPLLAPAAFGQALADAARDQTSDLVIYNDTYRHMSYPWGDVAPLYGVCTDVVIRAYRALGIDLQQLVHESALGSGDTSIEHRRVETLRRYFSKFGESLPISAVAEDYLPGDIVTYYRPQNRHSKTHIAVVSNEVGPSGHYKIIHNRGWGPQSEDALFVDEITGHYRYWNPRVTPANALAATAAKPTAPFSPRHLRTASSRLHVDGVPVRGLGH